MTLTSYVATKDLFQALVRAKRGLAPIDRAGDRTPRDVPREAPVPSVTVDPVVPEA